MDIKPVTKSAFISEQHFLGFVCVCVFVLRGDAGVTLGVFGAGHNAAGFRVKLSIRTVWTILI